MSSNHPIIAVTGSSGANRQTVRETFEKLCHREGLLAAYVQGDGFHRFDRNTMKQAIADAAKDGNPNFSHFCAEANLFEEQEMLYRTYSESGMGKRRFYLHNWKEAEPFSDEGLSPGEFSPWEEIPGGTDMMVYEGLHGWVSTDGVNLANLVDLKIGVVPVVNLEWIQKVHRDTGMRGYSEEAVIDTILRRMPDYVRDIVPQFRRSDINFQRVPVVDTSNPIIANDVPTVDESVVVIRFRKPEEFAVDFPWLLKNLDDSWMSRRNTIVVPGGKMSLAMQIILTPIINRMMEKRAAA
ncbi:MAG: phosphoribulokinase [Rhodospirillales bacterium]|nr:phosphoribulokinase [Alphaproteobacteria bacterium]MBL6947364.1 phosphoribulokinase [Rhodospirillales bacterium]